ncbi:uridine diphosphate glucose pyrophosphatase NUDT14-like isoform X4 [Bacillus rossius redtenbacheri]|uniref:uridine diphosphate glucose pyrophosphatase NUDT14-like isoform X4 n=1 Tax=Bacillus rossius redtenbacheri TaxID=93214 RepID=UPI002FDD124A
MNNITDITVSPLTKSSYLKPIKIKYSQNGVDKEQHLLKVHNSVAVLLFNTSRNVFVFVKQFRPAHEDNAEIETIKYPSEHGFTLELCAGILDQELPPEEIARLEVLEECGYVVPASNFKHIISLRNTALTGSKQAIFYAEVTDAMRSTEPTKEHRTIEVVELSVEEAKKYLHSSEVRSPAILLFSLMWFFQNKQK